MSVIDIVFIKVNKCKQKKLLYDSKSGSFSESFLECSTLSNRSQLDLFWAILKRTKMLTEFWQHLVVLLLKGKHFYEKKSFKDFAKIHKIKITGKIYENLSVGTVLWWINSNIFQIKIDNWKKKPTFCGLRGNFDCPLYLK